MRMLDEETDKKLNNVLLMLTVEEAKQVISYLNQLINKKTPSCDHFHISSDDYQKEVTICLYEDNKYDNFSERIKKLIMQDE
jgi:hypothetical protein